MKLHDESIEQLIRIAEDCIMDGNCEQGKRLLESALYDEPGYPKLHFTLGWMYQYYQENRSMAIRYYELAIHFDNEYEDAYRNLSYLYFSERMYPQANELLSKALCVNEMDKSFVYDRLGYIAEKQGNFPQAIKYYRHALEVCMDNEDMVELKKNIKRTRFKRFKKRIKRWQQ
jgi:Tfp pilus assembly protein PilF